MNAAHRASWLAAGAAVLAIAACSGGEVRAAGTAATLRWLGQQQGQDGLWHSPTYAVLRRGESTTAALVLALARLPATEREAAAAMRTRALAALATRRAPSPAADPDPVDYPCYTGALRLSALALMQPSGWRNDAATLVAFLRAHQLAEVNGWNRAAMEYGAFGLGDDVPQHPLGGDMVSLSVTTAVLEACAAAATAGAPVDGELTAAARVFVERCQRFGDGGDGGFCFAPTSDWRATKAGFDAGNVARSYGTATADGVRALLALGDGVDGARVAAALCWLASHDPERVPGLDTEQGRPLEPSLRLYWWASLAAVARRVPTHPAAARWRAAIAAGFAEARRSDGSYRGFGLAMKEDDPLVATMLALTALGER